MSQLHWALHAAGGGLVLLIAFLWIRALTSWSTQGDLTLLGATLEVTGIALLALDIFGPSIGRAWWWLTMFGLQTRLRELYSNVVGRLTGRKAHVSITIGTAEETNVAGSMTAIVRRGAPLSFKQVGEQLQAMANRITDIEAQNAAEHEKLRDEIVKRHRRTRRDVEEWIARSRDRFLPWRILGFGLALTGTVVLAIANAAG